MTCRELANRVRGLVSATVYGISLGVFASVVGASGAIAVQPDNYINEPLSVAVSKDGKNVYVANMAYRNGSVTAFERCPSGRLRFLESYMSEACNGPNCWGPRSGGSLHGARWLKLHPSDTHVYLLTQDPAASVTTFERYGPGVASPSANSFGRLRFVDRKPISAPDSSMDYMDIAPGGSLPALYVSHGGPGGPAESFSELRLLPSKLPSPPVLFTLPSPPADNTAGIASSSDRVFVVSNNRIFIYKRSNLSAPEAVLNHPDLVGAFWVTVANASVIFVVSNAGVVTIKFSGSWAVTSTFPLVNSGGFIAVDPLSPTTLYVTTGAGLHRLTLNAAMAVVSNLTAPADPCLQKAFSIAVSSAPKKLYLGGQGMKSIAVVDPATLRVEQCMPCGGPTQVLAPCS